MLASEIITRFELYVDDATELSSSQELDLLQKVFNKVWSNRPWEFVKANATGTFALTTPNITLPADFSYLVENNSYTDNTQSIENNAGPRVIFVSSSYTPFQVVNWSDRRQYTNQNGYAYLDIPNGGITFTVAPTATDTYDFDYAKIPPTLTLTGSITGIPAHFQPILWHLMALDDEMILHFPRASSYAPENKAAADDYMADMALWNANLLNN